MAEPKPLASLTSGLLARKGAAQPAMRRQMLSGMAAPAPTTGPDDLGWNDMGHDAVPQTASAEILPLAGLTPMPAVPAMDVKQPIPPVVIEREQLAEQCAAVLAPIEKKKAVSNAATSGRKAAFTLRLDQERHLKLRLACAIGNRSAQQIVTQALDVFLDSQPEVDRLAQQLPRSGSEK